MRPPLLTTPSVAGVKGAETWQTSTYSGISPRSSKRTSAVLGNSPSLGVRGTVSVATTPGDGIFRCVDGRLGSGVSEQIVPRQMGRDGSPYQLARTQGSVDSITVIPNTAERQIDSVSNRQYDGSSVRKASRRNTVKCSSRTNVADRGTCKEP